MRSKKWRFLLGAFVGLGLLLAIAESIFSPETALGYARFRVFYALTPSKVAALKSYDSNLEMVNGGYIPLNTDQFLCERLSASNSPQEKNAIIDFYVHNAGGREGQTIFRNSDADKQKAIGLLFQRLDAYDVYRSEQAMVLIESIRQGEYLGKAHLFSEKSHGDYETWLKESGVSQAKAKYRRWWNSPLSWSQKKRINPLEKSDMFIAGP
jgi:hypothetical protein